MKVTKFSTYIYYFFINSEINVDLSKIHQFCPIYIKNDFISVKNILYSFQKNII
jgi:hypothetical protein